MLVLKKGNFKMTRNTTLCILFFLFTIALNILYAGDNTYKFKFITNSWQDIFILELEIPFGKESSFIHKFLFHPEDLLKNNHQFESNGFRCTINPSKKSKSQNCKKYLFGGCTIFTNEKFVFCENTLNKESTIPMDENYEQKKIEILFTPENYNHTCKDPYADTKIQKVYSTKYYVATFIKKKNEILPVHEIIN
jgi:hypothetical protein